MRFVKIGTEMFDELKSLQKDYKVAIGEDVPSETELESLRKAIEQGHIHFYGCICDESLVACCSICVTYSTFNYDKSGVLEDFYITLFPAAGQAGSQAAQDPLAAPGAGRGSRDHRY